MQPTNVLKNRPSAAVVAYSEFADAGRSHYCLTAQSLTATLPSSKALDVEVYHAFPSVLLAQAACTPYRPINGSPIKNQVPSGATGLGLFISAEPNLKRGQHHETS